jgi:hypothetical protein
MDVEREPHRHRKVRRHALCVRSRCLPGIGQPRVSGLQLRAAAKIFGIGYGEQHQRPTLFGAAVLLHHHPVRRASQRVEIGDHAVFRSELRPEGIAEELIRRRSRGIQRARFSEWLRSRARGPEKAHQSESAHPAPHDTPSPLPNRSQRCEIRGSSSFHRGRKATVLP